MHDDPTDSHEQAVGILMESKLDEPILHEVRVALNSTACDAARSLYQRAVYTHMNSVAFRTFPPPSDLGVFRPGGRGRAED